MLPLLLIVACCFVPVDGLANYEDVFVDTMYGRISGIRTNLTNVFYGIPYSQPPVGTLRWKLPKPVRPWLPEILNATEPRAWCPQSMCRPNDTYFKCPPKISEDCLYLNIWTPLYATRLSRLPVMVYIHGGGFSSMSGTSLVFDGRYLVSKGDVIYVNMNYRLGALGFLVTTIQSQHNNFGIADQQLAMKWVYQNIINFGGDPQKVTLFGEGCGASSVMIHLMSKKSKPYFRNAIIESLPYAEPFRSHNEAFLLSEVFHRILGCSLLYPDMACLQKKTVEEIIAAQEEAALQITTLHMLQMFEVWEPWIDGRLVANGIPEAVAKGLLQKKPIIIGSVSEEAILFIYRLFTNSVDIRLYTTAIEAVVKNPESLIAVLEHYPPSPTQDNRPQLSRAATDYIFGCGTRNASRMLPAASRSSLWLYIFDHAMVFPSEWEHDPNCEGHSCHGIDVSFGFQSFTLGTVNYTQNEIALSNTMIRYFTNFAKYQNPNGEHKNYDPQWLNYEQRYNWATLLLQTPQPTIIYDFNSENCDLFDKIGYDL